MQDPSDVEIIGLFCPQRLLAFPYNGDRDSADCLLAVAASWLVGSIQRWLHRWAHWWAVVTQVAIQMGTHRWSLLDFLYPLQGTDGSQLPSRGCWRCWKCLHYKSSLEDCRISAGALIRNYKSPHKSFMSPSKSCKSLSNAHVIPSLCRGQCFLRVLPAGRRKTCLVTKAISRVYDPLLSLRSYEHANLAKAHSLEITYLWHYGRPWMMAASVTLCSWRLNAGIHQGTAVSQPIFLVSQETLQICTVTNSLLVLLLVTPLLHSSLLLFFFLSIVTVLFNCLPSTLLLSCLSSASLCLSNKLHFHSKKKKTV